MTYCRDCKGPCTRTIELNSKAPKNVKRLFGDIAEEIKAVSKMLKFQDMQKAKFIHALKRNNGNAEFDDRWNEMNELKECQLAEIEEAKIRLAAVNAEIKRKESLIKSYDANAENQPPGFTGENVDGRSGSLFHTPAPFKSSDSLLFPRPETGAPGFITSTPIPPQTQTGNHTLEGDFMKLRTPASWYNPEGMGRGEEVKANRRSFDRPRAKVKSPASRTSIDRSRVEVKSPMKTIVEWDMNKVERMKSPVEKALDKLLEDDSPVKITKNRNHPYHDRRRKKNYANPYPSVFNPIKFFNAIYK